MKRGNEHAQVLANLGSSSGTFLPCLTGDPDIIMNSEKTEVLKSTRKKKKIKKNPDLKGNRAITGGLRSLEDPEKRSIWANSHGSLLCFRKKSSVG